LCCGVEFGGDPEIYTAIQKWLNGTPSLEKPQILSHLGEITILDIDDVSSPEEHKRRVVLWAKSVWDAYVSQHELAHQWIRRARELE
jgi:hypothetical protein